MATVWNERRLAVDDGVLVWDEDGGGPSVMFLSGGPGDSGRYLRALAQPLVNEFHCIIPDLRGTGRSAVRERASLSVSRLIEDLEAVRRAERADRILVIGHSFGANLAVLYAATSPAVAGAVLIGLGPLDEIAEQAVRVKMFAGLTVHERSTLQDLRRRRTAAFEAGDQGAFEEAFLAMFELRLPMMVVDRAAGQRLLDERRRDFDHDPKVHIPLAADLARIDQWAAVRALQVPLLVVHGEQDFELDQTDAIAAFAPSVERILIEGAAHLPWLDRPTAVADALRHFLQTCSN